MKKINNFINIIKKNKKNHIINLILSIKENKNNKWLMKIIQI